MRLLSILGKGIQAMVDEAMTPESFKVGQKFEEYVRARIFTENYYDLVEKTHNYNSNNKDFVESSIKPDFKFRDRWSKKEFYVEAKFRTGLYQGKITWCRDYQLKRYQEIHKTVPVFILTGMGENPSSPEFISLIPMHEAKYVGLFPSVAEKFEIDLDRTIHSKILWNR
jgi:hypothetical protein